MERQTTQKFSVGEVRNRVPEIRSDLREGDHHKSSLGKPGVGDHQLFGFKNLLIVGKQIEIEHARPPSNDFLSPEISFETFQNFPKPHGVVRGLQLHDAV